MNLLLFSLVAALSALTVYPGFELLQTLSIKRKEIPPRGVREWQGRPFLHWDRYSTMKYGDLVFFSLLNGFVAVAFAQVTVDMSILTLLPVAGLLAIGGTYLWYSGARKQFVSDAFNRWDAGFTAPNATLTVLGKFHLLYFWLELNIVIITCTYLLWQPVEVLVRAGMAFALLGYLATILYDARKTGVYLGPLTGL